MSMVVKQSDIESIINAASKELAVLFEPQTLEKAEEKKPEVSASAPEAAPKEASSEAASSGAPEVPMESSPEGTPPAEETPGSPSAEGAEVPTEEMAPQSAQAAPSEPEVPGALEVVYSGMPPEMLKAHYVAIKKVIFAKHKSGLAEAEMQPEGEVPAEVGQENVPPQEAEPENDAPPVMKAEESMSGSEGSASAMSKNETPNPTEEEMAELKKTEELEKKLGELQKGFDNVVKVLELAFQRPERKAVTSLEGLAKSEVAPKLSDKEIREKAVAMTTDSEKLAKLTKSERDLLLSYFDGSVDVSKISNLVTK